MIGPVRQKPRPRCQLCKKSLGESSRRFYCREIRHHDLSALVGSDTAGDEVDHATSVQTRVQRFGPQRT